MKKDGITKLYDKLTNKERAALAFRYLTDTNELELERVAAGVPRKMYECPDMEYQRWFDSFFYFAAAWAIEYWQTYCRKLAAQCSLHVFAGCGEQDKMMALIEAHQQWESRLLALDRVLAEICEEHCIDPDAARRLAGADTYTPLQSNVIPDAAYQAELDARLRAILTRSREGMVIGH